MKYSVRDLPRKWYEWLLYPIQMLLAVFVATVLISNICGTPIGSGLIGAAIGTLIYEIVTKFKSPMFISNSGATVSAVIGALALGGSNNYIALAVGGIVIFLVYVIFACVVKFGGLQLFNRIFPPTIVGPVTIVIGINLAGFIPTYLGGDNITTAATLVALATMFITAIASHYFSGFCKTIAFLIGLLGGYFIACCVTWSGVEQMVDFSIFNNVSGFFVLPDFAFLKWYNSPFEWSQIPDILLLFVPVSICALLEHYSDHSVLSNILGVDLRKEPGLHRTLIGDGLASAVGTMVGGQPNTSYGESTACIGFSGVGSVFITTAAAALLALIGFIQPICIFLQSIPNCVFGGCAMILYGYIAASGLKLLINDATNLDDNKNLIVVAVIVTIGVSGICLFTSSFAGTSLAMVVGVLLNLVLVRRKTS